MVEVKPKPIIRVRRKRILPKSPPPKGDWTEGIQSEHHAILVGQIITILPHVEELLIKFLSMLLGHRPVDNGVARQVLRAIESERARINLMKALLEDSYINESKPEIFDEVINLFGIVKTKRNDLAHGLWYTHENGSVYLAPTSHDNKHVVFMKRRKVTIKELEADIETILKLEAKIEEATKWVDPDPNPLKDGFIRLRLGKLPASKPKPA